MILEEIMNFKKEEYFQRILLAKNWNNIILRDKMRKELVLNIKNEALSKYFNSLTKNEIKKLRERLFKLVKDKYVEFILKEFSFPILKTTVYDNNDDDHSSIINNLLDFIDYINGENLNLPKNCIELKQINRFNFPLGKSYLIYQSSIIKEFRYRLIEIQIKLNILKKSINNFYQIENSLNEYKKKYKLIQLENNYLKGCISMLVCSWIITISVFLFI